MAMEEPAIQASAPKGPEGAAATAKMGIGVVVVTDHSEAAYRRAGTRLIVGIHAQVPALRHREDLTAAPADDMAKGREPTCVDPTADVDLGGERDACEARVQLVHLKGIGDDAVNEAAAS